MTALLCLLVGNVKVRIRSRALQVATWAEGKRLVGDTLLDRIQQEWGARRQSFRRN